MSDIDSHEHDHVTLLELRRPPANYFDLDLISDLADQAFAAHRRGARALVLASEGKHFCAGADFASAADGGDRSAQSVELYRAAVRLFRVQIPIVAAVQGSAVGGGFGLACAADFRVASPATRFHANFVHLGFHPGFGLTASLPAIVGRQKALDLLLNGRRITGEEAHQVGLVDQLAPDGEIRRAALDWAHALASAAPLAVQSVKNTLRAPLAAQVESALDHELVEQVRHWQSEDFTRGVTANLARTTATFVGR